MTVSRGPEVARFVRDEGLRVSRNPLSAANQRRRMF